MKTKSCIFLGLMFAAVAAEGVGAAEPIFEKDVLPILTAHCLSCHGGFVQRRDLDLRSVATIKKGGKSGSVVEAGAPDKSLLWQKIASDEMPKGIAKLSVEEKKILRDWIAAKLPVAPVVVNTYIVGKARDPLAVAGDIDRLIEQRLQAAKVKAAAADAAAADAEFLRRVSLDILGRLPTADQARKFLDSKDPSRRSKLIEELLGRPDFGQHWGTLWHHWIVPPNDSGKRSFDFKFLAWLAESFNRDQGWDGTVREMVNAVGDGKSKPQIGFMLANPDATKAADKARRIFLGVNMECAECHDHPFTQWRQKEDFWGLAAFFSQVQVAGAKGTNSGSVKEKTTVAKAGTKGGASGPSIKIPSSALRNVGAQVNGSLLGEAPDKVDQTSHRPVLSDWIVSPKNPYFARAAVNRWWWHLFGRGFVMPLDNFHDGNPGSHPELLDMLAQEFRASGHSVKHLIRCLCNSKAYQRSSQTQEGRDEEEQLFGRMPLRLLPPEVLYDAYTQVLGIKDLSLHAPISRKGEIPTPPRVLFVNAFDHSADLPEATAYYHDILQILQLLNTSDLNHGGNMAKRLAALGAKEPAVDELYLSVFSRRPEASEAEKIQRFLARQPDLVTGYNRVIWALLNSAEFAFNH